MAHEDDEQTFTEFARGAERRLRHALTPLFGVEGALEATAEALTYGWQHWNRIQTMANPVGYLYTVGRSRGRKRARKPVDLPPVPGTSIPWIEPALPEALDSLPARQRQVVMLIHAYGWTQSEVAEVLGVSKPTVQTHLARAIAALRLKLGVPQ